jgi:hypothetical protein
VTFCDIVPTALVVVQDDEVNDTISGREVSANFPHISTLDRRDYAARGAPSIQVISSGFGSFESTALLLVA